MRKLKETVADVEWLVSEWDYDTNSALGIFPDNRLAKQYLCFLEMQIWS